MQQELEHQTCVLWQGSLERRERMHRDWKRLMGLEVGLDLVLEDNELMLTEIAWVRVQNYVVYQVHVQVQHQVNYWWLLTLALMVRVWEIVMVIMSID